MAITKTTSLHRLEVIKAADSSADAGNNAAHPVLSVVYLDSFDDAEDSTLPVSTRRGKTITKYVEDGGAATDYSGEDALVVTVADAIWA